jgi:hypothetical protein
VVGRLAVLNAVYLSGWEYNRILRATPFDPIPSGLPAQVLWNGAAQFWFFEKVFCTKESLAGDLAAYEALGWTSGWIFSDLQSKGFIESVDWNQEAAAPDGEELLKGLLKTHRDIQDHIDETTIRLYLAEGRDAELEAIKLNLLWPLLKHKHCVTNISPNSIRHWIDPGRPLSNLRPISAAVTILDNALRQASGTLRAGFRLCDPPGTGLDDSVLQAQRQLEEHVQRPLIPDLLRGALSQKTYHEAVAGPGNSYLSVYEPVNRQVLTSYKQNIEALERLRDVAKEHLWPQLHGEWLPTLEQDSSFLPRFQQLIRDALLRVQFDPFLKWVTDVSINAIGSIIPLMAEAAVPGTGLPMAGIGVPTSVAFAQHHDRIRKESDALTLFLQRAAPILRRGL